MPANFITYQRFDDIALFENLLELLKANHIAYETVAGDRSINPLENKTEVAKAYEVKIAAVDFVKVNKILLDAERVNLEDVPKDHYLFTFSDYELLELLTKADEWSAFDYNLAKKILMQRGITINEQVEEELRQQRMQELSRKEKPQTTWIALGYVLAFCGGLLGLFIGWHLANSETTLPDGTRFYTYTNNDRWHGRNILFLSVLGVIGAFIYRFATAVNS